jgi:hypothetical protein
MPDRPQNWTDYFLSLPGYDQGNRDSTLHSQIWSPDAQPCKKMHHLLSSENNAIILAADADRKIIALHSFNNIGNSLVCLVGGGRDAPVIRVIEGSLTAPCSGATPRVEELMACTAAKDVDNTTAAPANNNYQGSATFLGAPWLTLAVMKARTRHPHKLIPIAIDAARACDYTIAKLALDSVENFVQWAWLVGAGKITNIEVPHFSIDMDFSIKAYRNEKEYSCFQNETTNWGTQENDKLEGLFINTTVDPSNFAGVYIVWVLREYFRRHFDRCRNNRQREFILLRYRKQACDFLADMSFSEKRASSDRKACEA